MIQKLPWHTIAWEKNHLFYSWKKNKQTNKLVNKKRKYFKNQTRVSKKAALEAHRNAILAKRMKSGKDGTLLKTKRGMRYTTKNVNQALKHRLKLKKVLPFIRFEQVYRMKPYILLNNRQWNSCIEWFWTTAFLEIPRKI